MKRILHDSPEASQWLPERDDFFVAELNGSVVGVLVWRTVTIQEFEILNIAVEPRMRRSGVARALLAALPRGTAFLEVRESNVGARALYLQAGFEEVGLRPGYYQHPPEGAIVMKMQS